MSTIMKNPFDYIQEYPKRSKGLLGISHEQFLQLVRQAEIHERQQQAQRERTKIRLNAKGGGRPPKLTIAEQVCLCLFYLRHLIRLVKLFRIAQEKFRLHPDTYKSVILAVCGLVRLRMGTWLLPVLS